eukprot:CAMPEP_0176249120 /NCGR_PEP_ID=MMETSP0121_2-20121125/33814_1 /TAXON_ID=160619 /ORGANISM="Kryptoperidinium foliaceum, Strain CCMP 1326" /LENGTH=361 /DNA_ID=CAMNT_0017588811 /DNA_START=444 /DNA_END=1525 /DNA_ORIENTATION=-
MDRRAAGEQAQVIYVLLVLHRSDHREVCLALAVVRVPLLHLHVDRVLALRRGIVRGAVAMRPVDVLDGARRGRLEDVVPVDVKPAPCHLRVLRRNLAVLPREHHVQVEVVLRVPHQCHHDLASLRTDALQRLLQLVHEFVLRLGAALRHLGFQVADVHAAPAGTTDERGQDAGEEELGANRQIAHPPAEPLRGLLVEVLRLAAAGHELTCHALVLAAVLLLRVGPPHGRILYARLAVERSRLPEEVQHGEGRDQHRRQQGAATKAHDELGHVSPRLGRARPVLRPAPWIAHQRHGVRRGVRHGVRRRVRHGVRRGVRRAIVVVGVAMTWVRQRVVVIARSSIVVVGRRHEGASNGGVERHR